MLGLSYVQVRSKYKYALQKMRGHMIQKDGYPK